MIDSRLLLSLPFAVFTAAIYFACESFGLSNAWFLGYIVISIPNLLIILSSQKDKSKEEVSAAFAKADFSHLVAIKNRG